jgi:CTP:molybdopterin cytidylyltransferase MocA
MPEPPTPSIAAVVLAGGAGRRFGGAKQLHEVDGRPMLELVLAAVEASGIAMRVVVLGARGNEIAAAVPLHGATPVVCAGWEDGQAASLRCALDTLPAAITEALVVLGDGPRLDPVAVARVSAGQGVRAADYGHGRSHPVVLPRAVWDALPRTGETPARSLRATLVDCRDLPDPGDVDYPPA